MYYNSVVFRAYTGRSYFFLTWTGVLLLMEALFFISYVVSERNTTYIAAGGGTLVLIVMALAFPLKTPYRESTIVGGEPLISPGGGDAMSTSDDTD
jgi:hypothetical protein